MSDPSAQFLWRRLAEAGLVTGEPPAEQAHAPWFVRVMLGISGWIGALFLLAFVGAGMSFVMESAPTALIAGLAACGVAWLLFLGRPNSDFFAQFALALSIAGQMLVAVALDKGLDGIAPIALAFALFQSGLFAVMPSFLHRLGSAALGAASLVVALVDWGYTPYTPALMAAACATLWLEELRWPRFAATLRAAGYGLALVLMGTVALTTHGSYWWHPPAPSIPWLGPALSALVLPWAVWRLLLREGIEPLSGPGGFLLGVAAIVAAATLKAPGLAPATLILLLGFAGGNRVLAGLGVIALLSYISLFYYSLEATLLYKSGLMALTGLLLLSARVALQHLWQPDHAEGQRHA